MDDLSLVSEAFLDERHTVPVTASFLSAAVSSASNPGGITGHLLNFNGTAAYALIGFLAFAEAALMVGFFFPGETAVVIGGVLAGLGRVNLGVMIVVVVLCAVTGDSVGYEVGKKAGPWLLEHRPLKGKTAVKYTLGMLERYGGPAVFLGRFTAFARAMIPGLAGMSGMESHSDRRAGKNFDPLVCRSPDWLWDWIYRSQGHHPPKLGGFTQHK